MSDNPIITAGVAARVQAEAEILASLLRVQEATGFRPGAVVLLTAKDLSEPGGLALKDVWIQLAP
ncbi:MAG: hypothetical protein EOO54_08390 [Haliea sp.]|nr:MAG: hypothetical protein EOO54_08390 [Haliea sp.]